MIGKYLLVIAGLAAVVGLFLPYLVHADGSLGDAIIEAGATPPNASIFGLLTGAASADEADDADESADESDAPESTDESTDITAEVTEPVEDDSDAMTGLMLIAAPSGLLLLLGLLTLAVRYGKALGVLALLVGLAGAGFNAIAYSTIAEQNVTYAPLGIELAAGMGMLLMLGGGGLGALAGLLGIVAPQKADDGKKKKKKK